MRRACALRFAGGFGAVTVPKAQNEPLKEFRPDSAEAKALHDALDRLKAHPVDVPVIIHGKEYRGKSPKSREIPSDNKKVLHTYHTADEEMLKMAIESSLEAGRAWSRMSLQNRAAIFLKAATLLTTTYRYDMMAATMLGQSKNVWQAEIDCVAESADFFRFNAEFAQEVYSKQPLTPPNSKFWNMLEYRPLEGFILSITPFNFTAIGSNLSSTPALMGNTVLWKPASTSILSNYLFAKIYEEAGFPAGVINFLPSSGADISRVVVPHRDLAGIAFTGSTGVFNSLWHEVGKNIAKYRTYPRLSGETGGKNFHLIHSSAHIPTAAACTVRGAFEYQGQKCSACSRVFVARSVWQSFREKLLDAISKIKVGSPDDFSSFMCAMIDKASFETCERYIKIAREDPSCEIIAGGSTDRSKGWFVQPTVVVTTNPFSTLMKEEIFGPILTIYVYDDAGKNTLEEVTGLINHEQGTTYALTGSIFARDRDFLNGAADLLRNNMGNLYINDKSTGAVVGQQPFGGGRASGTNDKAGSAQFLQRWVSMRTIKETFEYLPEVSYPHQLPDVVRTH